MSGSDVFEKFLGLSGPENDPATLLGFRADSISEGVVVTALQNRLTQIAAHPEGMSPEADEVRLALHAAAARLLSPAAKKQPNEGTPASAQPEPTPLEAAILLTLATMGGWNARSRERIGVLAQTYGVPTDHVVSLAESLMGRPVQRPIVPPVTTAAGGSASPGRSRAGPQRFRPGRPAAAPGPSLDSGSVPAAQDLPPLIEDVDPGNRVVRNLVVFGAVALFGSAALIVLSVSMAGGKSKIAPPATEPTVTASPAAPATELFPTRPHEDKPKPAPPTAAAPARVGDWDDLLRSAAKCVATLESDTDKGIADFEKTYNDMSLRWTETSGDGLVAAVDRLVEFLYRAGAREGAAERAIEVVVEGSTGLTETGALQPEAVIRGAWTAGVLARANREKDLPASVRNRVHDALVAIFPGASGPGEASFQSGCLAALTTITGRLSEAGDGSDAAIRRNQDAWKAWLSGLSAVADKDTPLYTRHVLLALDRILTKGSDPLKSRAAFQAISILTTAVQWRKDDESRRWLLRWFESDEVAVGDLYAVTAALAGESGAEGVDSSMILSAGAGSGDRTEMRDRYAAMWGLAAGESRDALVQRWIDAVNALDSAQTPATSDPVVWGEEILQLARFNRAAMLLWAGDVDGVGDLLEPIQRSQFQTPEITQRTKVDALFPNQAVYVGWIRDYLAAGQNVQQRRELIANLTGALDPTLAEVLVEEACRGSPMQVRQDAKEKLTRFINTPPVLNALLEFAPLMPITRENAALVEAATATQLPALRDPTWRVAVRRALVEALLQVMAGQSPLSKIDRLSDDLGGLYAPLDEPTKQPVPEEAPEGQQEPPAAENPPAAAPALPIDIAVVQQRLRLQREAELLVPSAREPYNLAQMEQRRRARAELASGRVQEFEAEQVGICELMAYICVAEQPGRASQAKTILTEMDEQRRRCKTAFQQMAAAERVRLRLWMLRFSEHKA